MPDRKATIEATTAIKMQLCFSNELITLMQNLPEDADVKIAVSGLDSHPKNKKDLESVLQTIPNILRFGDRTQWSHLPEKEVGL